MATGTLPEAGQIFNSLITNILLLDNDLAVHYANLAAQQLLVKALLDPALTEYTKVIIEQADRGTLFLDEIGDIPLDVQTRLLRVLADGQFYRVGSYAPVKVDVRIIAATHQNLKLRVQEGCLCEDLFHSLNMILVHLPPLRER